MKKILFSLFLISILTFSYGCEKEDKNLTVYEGYELIEMTDSILSYKAVILKEDKAIELEFYESIRGQLVEGKVYDFYVNEKNAIRGYKEVGGD